MSNGHFKENQKYFLIFIKCDYSSYENRKLKNKEINKLVIFHIEENTLGAISLEINLLLFYIFHT